MKLKTRLVTENDSPRLFCVLGESKKKDHDSAAAHALIIGQDEFWKRDDLDQLDARDAVEMIGLRADELMSEWGFAQEKAE